MAAGPLQSGSMLQVANFGDDKHAASPWSDAQVPSAQCGTVLGLNSMQTPSAISMSQGNAFADLWPAHRPQAGGRRKNRSQKKMNRRATSRKNSRRHRKQRGGAAAFPDSFGTTLQADLRASAGVDKLDAAFAELPAFVGTYGMQRGGRRNTRKNSRKNRKNRKNSRKNRKNSRKNRKNSRKNSRKNNASRKQRGGAWGDQFASVNAPANLMPKDMYAYAHTNPQFYNENVINPNFNGPSNSYAM